MSDKDIVVSAGSSVGELNFTTLYDKALKVFSEQAMMGAEGTDIDVAALKKSKMKSENFLDAVAGILEIAHKVDLLEAQKDKFKRVDELRILNSLRTQFEKSAEFSDQILDSCRGQLEHLMREMETGVLDLENIEKLSMMQGIMERAVGNLSTISSGTTRLIKSERETGGRSSGTTGGGNNINVTSFLDSFGGGGKGGSGGGGKGGSDESNKLPPGVTPRKIGVEELTDILEKDTVGKGRPRKTGRVAAIVDLDDE